MELRGLTQQEASKRLAHFGPNQIAEPERVGALKILAAQFKSPLIYVLIFAAIVSLLLNEIPDAVFILLVVVINAALGFFQEYKAENILYALKKSISSTVKVFRDGKKITIEIINLVPGDLFIIEPGVRIPADATLLNANGLSIDESVLTGESEPVHKSATINEKGHKPENLIFMGTSVAQGIGIAKVTATGSKTEFGKIAQSLQSKFDPPTPIKLELKKISNTIALFVVVAILFITLLGIIKGFDASQIFFTSVALGVSIIPEGLLISLTATLAIGMNKIMKKNAIVRNLPAAETLGSIDILCIDKTGTLTEGKMQVVDDHFTDKKLAHEVLAICNNDSNFIDKAIFSHLEQEKGADFVQAQQFKRELFLPFSSKAKYTAASEGNNVYAVGAPEIILKFCKEPEAAKWLEEITKKAAQSFRTVAVAAKQTTKVADLEGELHGMKFLGVVYLKDPVRVSVSDALAEVKDAGIEIKVITGDLKETALSILATLKMHLKETEIISGEELRQLKDTANFDEVVLRTRLFYRTSPDQKFDIVKSLQRQNLRVGMMGDGVNDSPAIKNAEIGISVDNATDVTKEVADLILLDSNFNTIVSSIVEGRNIRLNLRKIMVYLFADSLSETVLIILSLIFGLPLPLLPLQLLWINLIEDGLPGLALSFEPSRRRVLKNKPADYQQSIFDKKVIAAIFSISLVFAVIYFVLYKLMIDSHYDLDAARTIIFAGLSLTSLLFIFSAKTVDTNIWKENIFNNRFLNVSLLIGIVLLVLAVYFEPLQGLLNTVALNTSEVIIIVILSFADLLLTEVVKIIARKVKL